MYLSDIYTLTGSRPGVPCINVPCGLSPEGLPVGLQILAKHFDEATMFAWPGITNRQDSAHTPLLLKGVAAEVEGLSRHRLAPPPVRVCRP